MKTSTILCLAAGGLALYWLSKKQGGLLGALGRTKRVPHGKLVRKKRAPHVAGEIPVLPDGTCPQGFELIPSVDGAGVCRQRGVVRYSQIASLIELPESDSARTLCESYGGVFQLGSKMQPSRCFVNGRRQAPAPGDGARLAADLMVIVPGTYVRDPSMPLPNGSSCPPGWRFFQMPDGRTTCLRGCSSPCDEMAAFPAQYGVWGSCVADSSCSGSGGGDSGGGGGGGGE